MMTGNDCKRKDLDLGRRGADTPRELDLDELEAVEGGTTGEAVAAGAALVAAAAVGGVAGATCAAIGIGVGIAIGNSL